MEITLDKKDILNEVSKNHCNDSDFLLEIIDEGTSNWDSYKSVFKNMALKLKSNGEIQEDFDIESVLF